MALSEQDKFKTILHELHDRLGTIKVSDNFSKTHTILTSSCSNGIPRLSQGEILREKKRQTEKITGLELRGAYRTDDLSGSGDDDGDLERGTANLEVSWDILKHGFLHNSRRADALEVEAHMADLENDLKRLVDSYKCRRYHIKKEFSEMLIQLLHLKQDFIQPVYDVERRAYFKQWSFWDDYLVSEEDLLLTRHTLDGMLADPYFDGAPDGREFPPIIDINLAGLLEAIRQDDSYSALFSIEKEWLKAEQESVIHDSLRIYLRQEYGINGSNQDEQDLIAGLRFRVPLHTRQSELLDLQLRQVERKKSALLHDRLNQTRIRHTELQEQLRRTVRQYYRTMRAQERVKRTLYMVDQGDDKLITAAITRMRTSIEAHLELARAMEELYRRINEMFLTARIPFHSTLVQPVSFLSDRQRARIGNRSIYVWSKAFNRITNDDLRIFLQAKNISTVVLSDGKKTDRDKQARFIEQSNIDGIKIELITGDNSWIFERNHDRAVEKSLLVAEKTGHLHLDIEPQTLPDYQTNREQYIALYINLITKIKKSLLDRKLHLAVPFHWPRDAYRQLGTEADTLYIMAYGTTEPEVLLRRIRPILETVPNQKIVVVLRINDFDDEWAMEKMIEAIANKTSVIHFGIHDLGRFFRKWGISSKEESILQPQPLKIGLTPPSVSQSDT